MHHWIWKELFVNWLKYEKKWVFSSSLREDDFQWKMHKRETLSAHQSGILLLPSCQNFSWITNSILYLLLHNNHLAFLLEKFVQNKMEISEFKLSKIFCKRKKLVFHQHLFGKIILSFTISWIFCSVFQFFIFSPVFHFFRFSPVFQFLDVVQCVSMNNSQWNVWLWKVIWGMSTST